MKENISKKLLNKNLIKENEKFSIMLCGLIILLSFFYQYYVRFMGPDSGFTLFTAKKILSGEKYYYDFFETNFPATFYIYSIPVIISKIFNINEIYIFTLFYNILGILLLYISSKILKETDIYDKNNYSLYNLILICIAFIYFIRPNTLNMAEFGTKTSIYLFCIIPYFISFFKKNRNDFSIQIKCIFGILLAILVSLKPHYAIIPLFLEIYLMLKEKKFLTFLRTEVYIALFLYSLYLILICIFLPEFFFKALPITFGSYGNNLEPIDFILENFISLLLILALYIKYKKDETDKIFLVSYVGAYTLMIFEVIGNYDQAACFFAFEFLIIVKLLYNVYTVEEHKNNFYIVLFVYFFTLEFIFSFYYNIIYPICYLLLNIPLAIILLLILFKKDEYLKIIIVITSAIYFATILNRMVFVNNYLTYLNKEEKFYIEKYAKNERILFLSWLTIGPYPIVNYVDVVYDFKVPCNYFLNNAFYKKDKNKTALEAYNYFNNEIKNQIKKNPKLIFIDRIKDNKEKAYRTINLETYVDIKKYEKIGTINIKMKQAFAKIDLSGRTPLKNYEIIVYKLI